MLRLMASDLIVLIRSNEWLVSEWLHVFNYINHLPILTNQLKNEF